MNAKIYSNPFKETITIVYEDGERQVYNKPLKQLPYSLVQYVSANKMAGYDASKIYKWTTYKVEDEERQRYFGQTLFVISEEKGRTPEIGVGFRRINTQYARVKTEHLALPNMVWMVGIPITLDGKIGKSR